MRARRVLAVDDDPDFRNIAVRHLNAAGFECHAASDGAQALDLAVKRSPDLILLDILMPGLNGFTVLKALRADRRTAKTPVILVTGDSENAPLLDSASQNMIVSGFVQKPVDWIDMTARIRRALGAGGPDASVADVIARGPLRIDAKLRRASAKGVDLELGPKCIDLLLALAETKDGLVKPILAGMVWGASNKRTLHLVVETIRRLRPLLRRACGQEMIVNIPDGYKLL